MELPIDHFRLLGVSPTTDAQTVLRTLEQRLNRPPDHGFTPETLQARESLLRLSADLLTDSARREAYESELTALATSGTPLQAGLEIPTSRELGGLLLLLEADQPLECFNLARRGLQPPQAPTLGSGRETDLSLLAGLACLAGGEELQRHRRYEAAAHTLREGLQLLQRMGQHPHLRQQISDELRRLRPFRVLDLLSRSLAAADERAEGVTLLEELVRERGGLEGRDDPTLTPEEFQAFFKQIRAYLTVQEQVDLFSRWADNSPAADFLASTALTASGFAQRKPDRIAAAMQRLEATGQEGVQPLLACLHLLLGQVEAAQHAFRQGASPELQEWAEQQSSDPLAQLCAYCTDWLARDVLPGYRDLEADPDLEAYFADRDVQAYINRLAPPPLPSSGPEASPFPETWTLDRDDPGGVPPFTSQVWSSTEELTGAGSGGGSEAESGAESENELLDDDEPWIGGWWPRRWRLPEFPELPWPPPLVPRQWRITAAATAILLAGGAWLLLRPQPQATPIPVEPSPDAEAPQPPASGSPDAAAGTPAPGGTSPSAAQATVPLTTAAPTEADLQGLLETWLAAKAAVLAGQPGPLPLEQLARPVQIDRLQQERRQDEAQQQTQRVEAKVEGLTIEARSSGRIAVLATISYRDQRLDAEGKPTESSAALTLRNRYVFGRDGEAWRLASFGPVR
ncbi:DnaJ domain protein [Cyanobium sp. PCC 7001]|uniref:ARC6/PARC6 family protein n=1 Tax=Cyanobium sp. PCC 7001 TaxID=180281 RepID=UPI00018050B9|nr:ARC6/PARC6 family protein [Cyanobium sp. PCC 7001]EDY39760.1 DnaJ domain protein [Cyanobium sp. PCC 7001]